MSKRRALVGVGILAVVGLLLAGGWVAYNHWHKDKAPTTNTSRVEVPKPDVVLDEEQSEASAKSVASYEEINTAYANKDYDKAIALGKSYGADQANSMTPRLNAYSLCLQAALAKPSVSDKDECYEKGKSLAQALGSEEEKNGWTGIFDNLVQTKAADAGDPNTGR